LITGFFSGFALMSAKASSSFAGASSVPLTGINSTPFSSTKISFVKPRRTADFAAMKVFPFPKISRLRRAF
jgi:hypothetical protein